MNWAELQSLESRTLFSAIKLESDHVLVVRGNASTANTITVGLSSGGTDVDVTLNGDLSTFTRSDVRKLRLFGGSAADSITISETNGAFVLPTFIDGKGGNDTITGGSGNELIIVGKGASSITVGNGNDTILGHGDDAITAGNGNDLIVGGSTGTTGDDAITVGSGNDTIFSLAGNDTVTLGSGADVVWADHDTINAGSGDDIIRETALNNNTINPGTGTVEQQIVKKGKASGRVHEVIHNILDKAYWSDL
jgi:Ca2+-binding RTX toxin-like protein